jgi:thiamine-monophosphate kinase
VSTTTALASLGERGIVARIRERFAPASARGASVRQSEALIVGIGDDAAVAAPERGALEILTTDALVEGVHFDRRFSSLSDVGYKALAVNVSDIAAMGGAPRLALLSLMLPETTTLEELDALLDGFTEMAAEARVTVAGGNVTRSTAGLIADVSVLGAARPRRVLTRAGARPGDAIYVTGSIGAGAAGLGWLRAHAGNRAAQPDPGIADCVARYRRPSPRARIGAVAGRTRAATAAMDSSDGLADAVTQVAEASGTGAILDATALPIHPAASDWFARNGLDPVRAAIQGGDDYELLLTVSPRSRGRFRHVQQQARGAPITRIGEITRDRAVLLRRDGRDESLPEGFAHF